MASDAETSFPKESSDVASEDEENVLNDREPSKRLKIWEEGLKDLTRLSNSVWLKQLESLSLSVADEMKRLRALRRRLETLPEHLSDPSEHIVSTSKLVRATWSAIPRSLEIVHPALYILVGPASSNATSEDRPDGEPKIPTEDLPDLSTGRFELPERIIFKSMRLLSYIDFNIYDGSLPWTDVNENAHFTVMRPFKMLVYFQEMIRVHLHDLEKQRQQKFGKTEGEYDAEWQANPPLDAKIEKRAIDPSSKTSSELTGLIKDFRSLVKFMDHYMTPALARSSEEQVYFSDLWTTFPTGALIYIKDKKIHQKIWRVIQRNGGRFSMAEEEGVTGRSTRRTHVPSISRLPPFMIDCYSIDFDGTRYVPVFQSVLIEPFDGLERISNLSVLPLEAAESAGYIDLEAVLNSASNFVDCTRPTHRDYTGRNQVHTPNGDVESHFDLPENVSQYSEWIDSEVMVDIERALHAVPSWRPSTVECRLSKEEVPKEFSRINFDNDSLWDRRTAESLLSTQAEKWQKWDRDHPPTEREDLLLLPSRVFAFVFRTRKWTCLKLGKGSDGQEFLRKRKPRPEPWNDLELPRGHKPLVQSLIESHLEGNTIRKLHFDLVRAKGKGIIILLHGVPGVGKTSTAECAAEANGRPLLPITCGDLGTSPKEVESKLQEAFQLAQLWNCVLLLDEADVFLAQRSSDDIQRNALVSVFLRVLEYYEGILFLTSNRVGVFDEALKSRLHMALYYPPLDMKFTKCIWEGHLEKLTKSGLIEVDRKEIMYYAETLFEEQQKSDSNIGPVWNGRQIRNAFQSAVALAGYKHKGDQKIVLTSDHFQKVSDVSNQFNNYLWSIKSKTDADKAAQWGIRHDYWANPGTTRANPRDQRSFGGNSSSFSEEGLISFGLNSALGATSPPYPQQMAAQPMPPFQPQQQQQQFSAYEQGFMQTHGAPYGTSSQAQTQIGTHHGFSQFQAPQTGDRRQLDSLQPQPPPHAPPQQQQQQQQQYRNQSLPPSQIP